jgi:DNA-binding response OmpR family regulator
VLLAVDASKVTRLHPQTPPTVLVVEDDVVTRFMVADELRATGFKVMEASTADDAITILESLPVHLVFADIYIPGQRSGLDVAKLARARRPPPHVILTSGRARADDIPGLEELGAFIPKPYILARVVDLVCRTLDPTRDF